MSDNKTNNTDVTNTTNNKIEVGVGGKFSLEDMANVMGTNLNDEKAIPKQKSSPEPEVKKETAKKEPEVKEKPSVNPLLAKKEQEKEKEAEEKTEEVKAEAEAESQEETEKPKNKKIKFKAGENKYDLPPTATVKIPVDGEEVEMSLQDVINKASGNVAVEKRFTELDKERKAYIEDKEATERELTEILTRLQADDPIDALVYMGELAGYNPLEFRKSIEDKFFNSFKQYAEMDETEIELTRAKKLNESFLKYTKSKEEGFRNEQATKEIMAKTAQLREANGISEEEFNQAKSFIETAEDGKYKEDAQDPEKVVAYIDEYKRASLAVQALQHINPELAKREALVSAIASDLRGHKGVSVEQIVEYLKETYMLRSVEEEKSAEFSKTLSKKVEKNNRVVAESNDDDEDERPYRRNKSSGEPVTLQDLLNDL